MASGSAIENARSDYRAVSRGRQIKEALPVAWQQLLKDQDELLVELIADRVEAICGYKPEPDVVADFIRKLATGASPIAQPAPLTPPAGPRPSATPSVAPVEYFSEPEFSGFMINGQPYREGTAIDTLIRVFEVLSARDSTFLDRYAALPKHGRKRRYISRDKMDLYPGRPDLCEEYSVSRFGGWWIGTNYSRSTIRHAVELACQVAGLRWGTDLKLI